VRLALESILPLAASFQIIANVAQIVIAVALWLALLGVYVSRLIARRQLTYSYFDRFESKEVRRRIADSTDFWKTHDWAAFQQLDTWRRSEMVAVANLIEEVASQYNRKLLDRNIAALVLGGLIEALWEDWQVIVNGGQESRGEWVFREWERMQADTRKRRDRAHQKMRRQASWRYRAYGED
jgi:hypothetical protein